MKYFTSHLRSVNESYFQHMGHAFSFFVTMFVGSIACLLHGIFPFLFVKTGSAVITKLNDRMVINRVKSVEEEGVTVAESEEFANAG